VKLSFTAECFKFYYLGHCWENGFYLSIKNKALITSYYVHCTRYICLVAGT